MSTRKEISERVWEAAGCFPHEEGYVADAARGLINAMIWVHCAPEQGWHNKTAELVRELNSLQTVADDETEKSTAFRLEVGEPTPHQVRNNILDKVHERIPYDIEDIESYIMHRKSAL
jgi:hypothetical protein